MAQLKKIFVADFVPFSNKGEEAIIRGIEDMLGGAAAGMEIAVLGEEDRTVRCGNVTAFPCRWVYPIQTVKLDGGNVLRTLTIQALKQRLGFSGGVSRIARSSNPEHVEMNRMFRDADVILVGHDGIFNVESCAMIHVARKAGKRVGILGAGVKTYRKLGLLSKRLYRKAVDECDFTYFRERNAYEYMRRIGCDEGKLRLAPDPAFAMTPTPATIIRRMKMNAPTPAPRTAMPVTITQHTPMKPTTSTSATTRSVWN